MIDTHAHLDDPRFDADRDAMMARAAAAGVRGVVVPGVIEAQWPRLRAQAQQYGWRFGVGTHPQSLPESRAVPQDLDGADAIGECGLDGPTPVPMDEQVLVLAAHLALARDAGLPLILHCFRAHDRMLPLLRRYAPLRGVMHSYSGGPELVDAYVALGLHLSFAGPVTWDNARKPLNALRRVRKDRLLAETDAPDQCPRPHRGRSEPAFVVHVIEAMERVRGEALREQLMENACALGWGPR
ncbi:MAG: TatD family hydrolase [Myxococcota bacterium]